jgi:hypothetical protein
MITDFFSVDGINVSVFVPGTAARLIHFRVLKLPVVCFPLYIPISNPRNFVQRHFYKILLHKIHNNIKNNYKNKFKGLFLNLSKVNR